MKRTTNPGDIADDRATLARLRALLPKVMSSRQRIMIREAISHVNRRIRTGA